MQKVIASQQGAHNFFFKAYASERLIKFNAVVLTVATTHVSETFDHAPKKQQQKKQQKNTYLRDISFSLIIFKTSIQIPNLASHLRALNDLLYQLSRKHFVTISSRQVPQLYTSSMQPARRCTRCFWRRNRCDLAGTGTPHRTNTRSQVQGLRSKDSGPRTRHTV